MGDRIYILKPALRAFPKIWLIIIWQAVLSGMLIRSGNERDAAFVILFTVSPLLLLLILYRYGRRYSLSAETITFYNRFNGISETFRVCDIVEMNIKPIAFGAANTEFVLRNGTKKVMKNVVPKASIKSIQRSLRG